MTTFWQATQEGRGDPYRTIVARAAHEQTARNLETNMQVNEFVKCTGRLHAIVFWLPVMMLLPALLLVVPTLWAIFVGAFAVLVVRLKQESTRITVTNRRVIIKRGIRRTIQMSMNQVESIDVVQPYLGMIFNYGTVVICGTGGRREQVNIIADPFHLQKQCD